jgi:hypothetical protein
MALHLRGSTVEEKAFYALLAALFAITFSIALGQFLAGIALLLFVFGVATRRIQLALPPVTVVAGLFIVVALVTSIFGGEFQGLWGRCGKLLWFLLIPVTASLLVKPERHRMLILAFLAGCAALGVKDMVVYPVVAWRKPVPDFLTALIDKGSMTDGQMLMLGLVGSAFLVFSMIKVGKKVPWWCWGMLVAQAGGLLINFKRGSWFCALLLVGVSLMIHLRWKAWLLALVIVAGFFMLPPVQSRLGQLKREFNVEGGGRLTMWFEIAPALIREHPQGVGYRCLTNEMMREAFRRVEPNRNHLHANWAQVLVETGWLGLALYIAWMLKSVRDGIRWTRRAAPGGGEEPVWAGVAVLLLAGLLLNGLVEYNFGDTELMFIYAIVMGWVAAKRQAPSLECP